MTGRLDYQGIAWHNACRVMPILLRDDLRRRELWEDVRQEVAVAAWQAERDQLGLREASNFSQRAIYHALREMGFRRTRSHAGFTSENVGGEKWNNEIHTQ